MDSGKYFSLMIQRRPQSYFLIITCWRRNGTSSLIPVSPTLPSLIVAKFFGIIFVFHDVLHSFTYRYSFLFDFRSFTQRFTSWQHCLTDTSTTTIAEPTTSCFRSWGWQRLFCFWPSEHENAVLANHFPHIAVDSSFDNRSHFEWWTAVLYEEI